jgi:hypothetical protein
MKSDDRTPYPRDKSEGVAVSGTFEDGATPRKKPPVTTTLARMTFPLGAERVWKLDTTIVSGRTRPLAIWKKEASTPRRQRVLKTSLEMSSISVLEQEEL